jgi:hypothetical protein
MSPESLGEDYAPVTAFKANGVPRGRRIVVMSSRIAQMNRTGFAGGRFL